MSSLYLTRQCRMFMTPTRPIQTPVSSKIMLGCRFHVFQGKKSRRVPSRPRSGSGRSDRIRNSSDERRLRNITINILRFAVTFNFALDSTRGSALDSTRSRTSAGAKRTRGRDGTWQNLTHYSMCLVMSYVHIVASKEYATRPGAAGAG
jgi:hypothetical protein